MTEVKFPSDRKRCCRDSGTKDFQSPCAIEDPQRISESSPLIRADELNYGMCQAGFRHIGWWWKYVDVNRVKQFCVISRFALSTLPTATQKKQTGPPTMNSQEAKKAKRRKSRLSTGKSHVSSAIPQSKPSEVSAEENGDAEVKRVNLCREMHIKMEKTL